MAEQDKSDQAPLDEEELVEVDEDGNATPDGRGGYMVGNSQPGTEASITDEKQTGKSK